MATPRPRQHLVQRSPACKHFVSRLCTDRAPAPAMELLAGALHGSSNGVRRAWRSPDRRCSMVSRDFACQLEGYGLTTASILYRMPDHRSILQEFIWQD